LLEVRGKRVAYFMVDALRFELAVALERQLGASHTCRLQPVCAQLPTVTPVGMAALLPKAEGNLFLRRDGDELVPRLGDTGLLRLTSGQAVKVPLRIDEDFTGAFEVRAVDAETGVVYGSPLKLKAETIA
jgi:hypothetical protein